MAKIANYGIKTFVTIEPIMDYDIDELVSLIKMCKPEQVNIGANTYTEIQLPQPSNGNKLVSLILQLIPYTRIKEKKNLKGKALTQHLINKIKDNYSYEKRKDEE